MNAYQAIMAQLYNFVPLTFGQKEFGNRKRNRKRAALRARKNHA